MLVRDCGKNLLNLGFDRASLVPACGACSSRGCRLDVEGCVKSISTSGDSVRGAGSALRSCSCATACDCTSSSRGPANPKVNSNGFAILKVSVSNALRPAEYTTTKRQSRKLTVIHRGIVCKMDPSVSKAAPI